MVDKEILLRRVLKDVETTGDLDWIISNLQRIYIEKVVQNNILKVFNNRHYKNGVPSRE